MDGVPVLGRSVEQVLRSGKGGRPMGDFTYINNHGQAKMVDVGEKASTQRTATAGARVYVNQATFGLVRSGVVRGDFCREEDI